MSERQTMMGVCDGCSADVPMDDLQDQGQTGRGMCGFSLCRNCRMVSSHPDPRDAEIARLRQELETERLRLAACGVVAMSDTPESAAKNRDMHPDYRSASCDDVARRVDECMALRAQLAAAQADNAALRKVMAELAKVPDDRSFPMSAKLRAEMLADAIRDHAAEALATPAPGAPLLDAVRGLVEAVEWIQQRATCFGPPDNTPCTLNDATDTWCFACYLRDNQALPAVRAVLSPPQDTAGISRGGDSE